MTQLEKAFEECAVQLERIINAYKRNKVNPKTKVWRSNGTVEEYDIVGELGSTSIPNNANVTKVEIGSKVTSIGYNAFADCSELTSVTIGNGVTSIGDSAFYGCSDLTSVTIPNSVTLIKYVAFGGSSIMNSTFVGKTAEQVQAMDNYPWELPVGGTIHCSDINIVVPESGGGSSS